MLSDAVATGNEVLNEAELSLSGRLGQAEPVEERSSLLSATRCCQG